MTLWEEHLLPLLTCKDAARLACTCEALRGVVREHFREDLGTISVDTLQAALTTFPRARSVTLGDSSDDSEDEEMDVPAQWLREGGRGSYLEEIKVEVSDTPAAEFVHAALREGALPSLRRIHASLEHGFQRLSLTEGALRAMHELQLTIVCGREDKELVLQLAALGLVRQLPALAKLEVEVQGDYGDPVQWPPFIPRPLTALHIDLRSCTGFNPFVPLLRALPGMLEASGARLERLELQICNYNPSLDDGLVHVAQVLRCCSPTLKAFLLSAGIEQVIRVPSMKRRVERRRVQWPDVLAGVSACRELQVLVLPFITVEPLFPPGTSFARLTHLEISDHEREHPPDAGVMGLWELMASGGLPALAKLSVRLEGRPGGGMDEVRTRVAPGLEAVAGTLTHLQLDKAAYDVCASDEVEVGYELGLAVGKLRRLKDLALDLFEDCRAYHAMAQGLAASGGDRPLSLLWRVMLPGAIQENSDQVASLLLPSVRVFYSAHCSGGAALLTACAVRQAGYKYIWSLRHPLRYEEESFKGKLHRIVSTIAPGCCIRIDPGWQAGMPSHLHGHSCRPVVCRHSAVISRDDFSSGYVGKGSCCPACVAANKQRSNR
jgi:hypothetical protein